MADNFEQIYDILISGYFRKHEINISDIPQAIIKLIIEYIYRQYGLNNHIIIFSKSRIKYTDYSNLKMIDISNNYEEYSFEFKKGELKHDDAASYYVEYEMHPNLKQVFNLQFSENIENPLNLNSMILRCAGCGLNEMVPAINMILFDSTQVKTRDDGLIDGYVHSFGGLVYCFNASLYDKYNNSLVSVGGEYYEDDDNDGMFWSEKSCYIYDFNEKKGNSSLDKILPKAMRHPSVSILNAEKKQYLVCGGYSGGYSAQKAYNTCYNLDGSGIQTGEKWKLTELKSMNKARYGHCAHNLTGNYENKIIVGGGQNENMGDDDICKSFEIYDIEKNEWNLMKGNSNYTHTCGTIWSDKNNPNIVYIAGNISLSGYRKYAKDWDKCLGGFIEYTDLRDNDTKWQIMMDKKNKPFDIEEHAQYGRTNKIYSVVV